MKCQDPEDLGVDATNVLLLAPDASATRTACAGLLAEERSDGTGVCAVSTRSIDARLASWDRTFAESPAAVASVVVGDHARSTAQAIEAFSATASPAVAPVKAVEDPSDLTTLGVRCTEQFEALRASADRLAVCVDSLTDFLDVVEDRPLYQFLSVFTNQVAAMDARAHYHLDPDAHDRRTIETFTTVFDAVVERTEEGWTGREVGSS